MLGIIVLVADQVRAGFSRRRVARAARSQVLREIGVTDSAPILLTTRPQ